jgi:hypothetical protein
MLAILFEVAFQQALHSLAVLGVSLVISSTFF